MIYPNEQIEEYIKHVLRIVSVMRVELLIRIIERKFAYDTSDNRVSYILRNMQTHGHLLISDDNYVMTRGAYVALSNDIFYDKLKANYNARVPAGLPYSKSREGQSVADCMWIVADMIPAVTDVITNSAPWDIQFVAPADNDHICRLYQVTKFNRGEERVKAMLIEADKRISDMKDRTCLRRVALLDDESMSFRVPKKCGINIIAVLDDSKKEHFRILEAHKAEETW